MDNDNRYWYGDEWHVLDFLKKTKAKEENAVSLKEICESVGFNYDRTTRVCNKLHSENYLQKVEKGYYITVLGLKHFISITKKLHKKAMFKANMVKFMSSSTLPTAFILLLIFIVIILAIILVGQ